MNIEDNEVGGRSVFISVDDSLDDVPESHRDLITPTIRTVFVDPPAHFRKLVRRCPFRQMKAWLTAISADTDWELHLHRGDPPEWTAAGFLLAPADIQAALVAPSTGEVASNLPDVFKRYYALVDEIQWMPFGSEGRIWGSGHPSISTDSDEIDRDTTFVFGGSLGGDMLIYSADGRAGWLCHENGQPHWLGTIHETIDWVYGELLADRAPDFDYNWL